MTEWRISHDEVDLSLLYDLLRQQLCNPDDPWVKETLRWWDRYVVQYPYQPPTHGLSSSQVFPTATDGDDDLPDLRDMEGPSMRELMEIERAARMSQVAADVANV